MCVNTLAHYLPHYDPILAEQLLDGFINSVHVHTQAETHDITVRNPPSISQHSDIVSEKLARELKAGRMAGPFLSPPFQPFYISPLGLIPPNALNEWRLILNLSFPRGLSINDGIDPSLARVCYEDLDHVISIIQSIGPICYVAKSDLANAFHQLPLHRDCYKYMGFTFQGLYYFDRALVMSSSTSCATFEQLSSALQWILTCHFGVRYISHILDDFIFLSSSEETCNQYQKKFEYLCTDLNLPVKTEKNI